MSPPSSVFSCDSSVVLHHCLLNVQTHYQACNFPVHVPINEVSNSKIRHKDLAL